MPARDERGSIPLALLAVLVISGLVVVLLVTTVSAQRQARHDRDFTTVLFAADAAVQQARFRLGASTSLTTRVPLAGSTAAGVQEDCPLLGESWCVTGGSAATGTYEWYAQRIGYTRSWEVFAAGDRNGVRRRLRVIVEEGRRFFASAFADTIANFGNNNVADSYNSGRTGTARWPGPGRQGVVGSNGTVETGGTSTMLDGLHVFNLAAAGTTDPLTRCTGQGVVGLETSRNVCSQWAKDNPVGAAEGPYLQGFAQPRVLSPGSQTLREALNACGPGPYPLLTVDSAGVHVTPSGGTAQTVRTVPALQPFRVEPATLPNGQPNPFVGVGRGAAADQTNYYCFRRVRISVDTTVVAPQTTAHPTGTAIPSTTTDWTPRADMANPDDPVVLYITGNVEIETTRRFNCVACARPAPTDPVTFPPPRAGALQVFFQRRLDTDPAPAFHVGNDARFGGAVHGPDAACGKAGPLATAGTAADIYGAMVCGTIDGVGQWGFHYDVSLEFIGNTDFGTQRWDER